MNERLNLALRGMDINIHSNWNINAHVTKKKNRMCSGKKEFLFTSENVRVL